MKRLVHAEKRALERLQTPMTVLLLALLVAGCPASKPTADAPVEGKLAIKGSNTVGEELAPRLIAEYKKQQPKVTVELESKGTGSGFEALAGGKCDIAAASRVVNNGEIMGCQKSGVELNPYTIGSYAVAVVVNSSNSVSDLTREQIRDIFTGTIKNWKDLKGPDAEIHLYIRDPISGPYLGFRELAMEDQPY